MVPHGQAFRSSKESVMRTRSPTLGGDPRPCDSHWCYSTLYRAVFTDLANYSHAPPMNGVPSGIDFHTIDRIDDFSLIASFSSLSAPCKFVPLSEYISMRYPGVL
ncbi:hypothetical protein EVAR_49557_1 [Eumeta japonica]|uniref:Uncharacterized protein n=1 Tax=Eumeta variegata TaxID=151549 RepID=A0A4C1XKH8_EUMVA|nr:hypothetical protein EVAR_49557_1 [Eumeta japonica]